MSVIPSASEAVASARIRAHGLAQSLAALGHEVRLTPWADADVLYVQKSVDFATLQFAHVARASGRTVLYDVDDLGSALWSFVTERNFYEMSLVASAITTDTEGHRQELLRTYRVPRVEVIPDVIDYSPIAPASMVLEDRPRLRVLWFGNASNIGLFVKYAGVLTGIEGVQLVAVSDGAVRDQLSPSHPEIEFTFWSRASFVNVLRSCDVSCLMHDGTALDRAKSNNKMITSIGWGLPAVVSDTQEYARTAQEAGVAEAVFGDGETLRACIERLRRVGAREEYLRRAQPEIWRRYAPKVIAEAFVDVCCRVAEGSAGERRSEGRRGGQSRRPWNVRAEGGQSPFRRLREKIEFEIWRCRRGERVPAVALGLVRDGIRALPFQSKEHPEVLTSVVGRRHQRENGEPLARLGPESAGDLRFAKRSNHRVGATGGRELSLSAWPTVVDVRNAVKHHDARTALQIGCGGGLVLSGIAGDCEAEGCDVSSAAIAACAPGLRVFELDIAAENRGFLAANAGRWDVLFTSGVMCNFMSSPVSMAQAINNMLSLARVAIIVWEWPEVCARMREFSDSPKFDYRPIGNRQV